MNAFRSCRSIGRQTAHVASLPHGPERCRQAQALALMRREAMRIGETATRRQACREAAQKFQQERQGR